MRIAFSLSAIFIAVSSSSLQFISLPKSIHIPEPSTVNEIRSSISELNANLLGLSAKPISGFEVETDLFSRPRALAVVRIDGINGLPVGDKYIIKNDDVDLTVLDQDLALTFGANRETVILRKEGISGSMIAQQSMEQKIDDEVIKTTLPDLRTELKQVIKLAQTIVVQGARFKESDSADVYLITIRGVADQSLTEEERSVAIDDINYAIHKLSSALSTVYGNQAIIELISSTNLIQPTPQPTHHVIKREASKPASIAEELNVYESVSPDYPAIFAIFAGLSIFLALAVLYTVVGMMTMDPGKDSIIYRMTTTRMKKE